MANGSGQFDPSIGEGSYQVIYTYDFGNGCIKADTIEISVTADTGGGECTTPTNLALNQSASQSSVYGGGVASISVDGNIDGSGSPWGANPSLTHTQTESQPWWQVDLGQEADISQVNIYNRTSCCSERLKDFYILVSSQPFGASSLSDLLNAPEVQSTFISGQIGTLGNIPFEVTGRYVRLQLSSTNAVLHMAEIEVMGCPADPSSNPCLGTPSVSIGPAGPFSTDAGIQSLVANPSGGTWSGEVDSNGNFDPSVGEGSYEVIYTVDFGNGCIKADTLGVDVLPSSGGECTTPTNLALNQSANMSSIYGDGVASIGVDGNLDGSGSPWGANASLVHSQTESQPWWEVDLGQGADITQVNIFNRTSCCEGRFKDFYVMVSSQPFGSSTLTELLASPQVQSTFYAGQFGTEVSIPLSTSGRYVRIQLSSTNAILHFAEVEVMGCPTGTEGFRLSAPNTTFSPEEAPLSPAEMYLQPNPTDRTNGLKVRVVLPTTGEFMIELFNPEGKRVGQLSKQSSTQEISFPLELSNFPSGIYFIRAYGEDWTLSKRFVVE